MIPRLGQDPQCALENSVPPADTLRGEAAMSRRKQAKPIRLLEDGTTPALNGKSRKVKIILYWGGVIYWFKG